MAGNTAALSGLYASERTRLLRLVQRIVGNRAAAEDLTQDAFVKLSGRTLGPADHGLLFRTAQNLALDHLRGLRIRESYTKSAAIGSRDREEPLQDRALEARQQLKTLLEALETLPERARRIFLLSRVDGLSQPEIARLLGVSLSTVEKELVRTLAFCRAWKSAHEGLER